MTIEVFNELAAVNLMLPAAGESAITSLEELADDDSSHALATLRAISREVQEEGWDFNTELKMKLLPNTSGHVNLPPNTLSIDPVDPTHKLVQRGNRFYDPTKHTYIIGRPVEVDLVVQLPFDDLPSAARTFICIRACRRFTDDAVTSATVHRFKQEDEMTARANLERAHSATQDENLIPAWRYTFRNPRRF